MAQSPRAAFKAFSERVTVDARKQSEEFAKRQLIQVAEEVRDRVLREQTARAGIAPTYRQYVDGREGAPLQAVKPIGTVVFEWDYVREIASQAIKLLRDAGPEVEGDWKKSIAAFADDVEIDPETIPARARSVVILPTVIYARYLERVENFSAKGFGLVAHIALDLKRLYRQVARVDFTYSSLGHEEVAAAEARMKGARKEQAMRYPTILVRPLA